jgi:hypothetical protein
MPENDFYKLIEEDFSITQYISTEVIEYIAGIIDEPKSIFATQSILNNNYITIFSFEKEKNTKKLHNVLHNLINYVNNFAGYLGIYQIEKLNIIL